MSRTRRKLPGRFFKKDPWCGEPDREWYDNYLLAMQRGHLVAGYVHCYPRRDGGYRWYETAEGPVSKRYYKRLVRRFRRRVAKEKIRQLSQEIEKDAEEKETGQNRGQASEGTQIKSTWQ